MIIKNKHYKKNEDQKKFYEELLKQNSLIDKKKNYVYSVPQFLQPISLTRLNIDLVLDWSKKESSFFENWSTYKKICKVQFNNKKNVFDSIEIDLEMMDSQCTPIELVIDRLQSVNDSNAKELSDIFEKMFVSNDDYWVYEQKNDYRLTSEYKEFLQKIEMAKSNRNGQAYTIFHGRYEYKIKGIDIYKITFSKRLIDLLYNGKIDDVYCDFLNNTSKIPFLCYVFDNKNYEYINEAIKTLFLNPNETVIKYKLNVDVTKDGIARRKAEVKHSIFKFFDPNDNTKICEIVTFLQFKCFDSMPNIF